MDDDEDDDVADWSLLYSSTIPAMALDQCQDLQCRKLPAQRSPSASSRLLRYAQC